MIVIKYTDDFDNSLFAVTKVNNSRIGRKLTQKDFIDNNTRIYNISKPGLITIKNRINFRYNISDTVELMLLLEQEEGTISTANSLESKTAKGKSDEWTLTKENDLYRLVIKRGGDQKYNADLLMNKHTKECIHDALWNEFVNYNCKLKIDKAEDKAEDKAIKNASETAPESTKDDLPSIPKPKEETLTTAQINDNNDSIVSIVSESVPESTKEEKVEENKLKEESLTTDQINDNNDSIIGQSIPEVKQEEVKTKTVWDAKEIKDIVFKVEKIDENKLDEVSLSKKSEIAGYFWPSHADLLAKLYGIRVPIKENDEPNKEAYKEGYEEIRKYFGKLFGIAV